VPLVKGMLGRYLLKPRQGIVGEIEFLGFSKEILYERRKDILELGTRRLCGHGGGRGRSASATTAQSILVFRRERGVTETF